MYGFNANQTFWTDSNGLRMVERKLNYQSSYVQDHCDFNISNNFYPVTSAIAIRDPATSLQLTVLNDRTQAGSADLQKSIIELIHHRRLLQDDQRGVEEPLNERDGANYGIKVNARYFLQIFNKSEGSLQREK